MAPWGPVMALPELRCGSWTFIGFIALILRALAVKMTFASPRGGLDKREHVPFGGRLVSLSPPLRTQTFSPSFGRIFTPV